MLSIMWAYLSKYAKFHVICLGLFAALLSTQAHAAGRAPAAPEGAQAQITAVRALDGRTRDITVSSPAMGMSIPVRVILPPSWNSAPNATFPVLYMLHGGNDDYTSWTRETDIEALSRDADVIVVMPDAGKAGYYSDWFAGGPRWETFHTDELVRLMEREYRASPSRAIVGLSMGGFGALNYAARHRGLFRYVASMSSYVDLNDPAVRLVLGLGSDRDGVDIRRVWGDPVTNFAVWQAHNPSAMPEAYRGMRVHLSAGNSVPGPLDAGRRTDQFLASIVGEAPLAAPIRKFAASLRAHGVDVTTDLYGPGTHSWPYWQNELHRIWPDLVRTLGARSPMSAPRGA